MANRARVKTGKLHAFDRWIADEENEYMLGQMPFGYRGSFKHLFDKNVAEYADLIVPHEGDATKAKWSEPIQILFLDCSVSCEFHEAMFRIFYPHLHTGAILIQQDYFLYRSYYLPPMMARLGEYINLIGNAVKYRNAGTVEFLQDAETGKFYFIEVNPRIQVEHTVTEAITGIDLVKAQIRVADGAKIGDEASGVPKQADIHITAHALQCRVTTEDPENNFSPDYGKITAYRSPAGFGIRLDAGTAYAGAILTRSYDSMLVKVTAWAPNPVEAIARMARAFMPANSRIVPAELSGTLLITDAAPNLKKVYALIRENDQKPTAEMKKKWKEDEERRRQAPPSPVPDR
jgi:hypothetical protein